MLARVRSGALVGVDAVVVDVEVDMALGLPFFHVVGLPEGAVKESKVRVVSALKNSGYELPHKRITVNLAPADIRKEGAAFELPIAIGVLAAARILSGEKMGDYLYGGELSLDGAVKPIRGVLPLALAARDGGFKGVVVPTANAAEAALVDRIEVIPVTTVADAFGFLQGEQTIAPALRQTGRILLNAGAPALDMSDVRGQNDVKNALEVAAAGGHNVLMCGPPGSGKTMLARRLSTILPPMDFQETLEVTKIYSVLGLIADGESMIHDRPFRAPHHTISNAGLVGGGPMARPGELSMAHRGVLFLDELPEFQKHVLEVLRQPLEEGVVRLARANQNVSYPCQVMLVAAMNPCRCGYFNVTGNRVCVCTQNRVAEYHARVSGPLLDRVDITLETRAVEVQHMTAEVGREKPSEWYRQRVIEARQRQAARFKNTKGILCNAQMSARQVRQMCLMVAEAQRSLQQAVMQHGLSARAHDRILKMARTRADLEGHERIEAEDMRFAIDCRVVDRRDWLKQQAMNRTAVQVFKDPAQQGVLGGGGGGS
ncbi:MAG: YifB family Mg chelatase-like AAA ATPase [Myxococcaceae bacterium]|nr:YifB family Mg chelatase-like AAA ATPase [Myxococcaceae bacterium]